jgi:HKD family nuclease
MEIGLIDNSKNTVAETLSSLLRQSEDIRIAVAFISRDGLSQIDDSLTCALAKGARVEFLVGMDAHATDPKAIRYLYSMTNENPLVSLFCFVADSPASIYHPKLYLTRRENDATAIIGSSNLTRRGISENVEVNVLLHDEISCSFIAEIYDLYNKLKFHKNRVIPDAEFIEIFEDLCGFTTKKERLVRSDSDYKKISKEYIEKAGSLKRPKPGRSDLVGWLELVYDSLPDGIFTNSQVYRSENLFKEHYPDNLNIRAKIRQQLQVLENLGLVRHEGTGKWSKVG